MPTLNPDKNLFSVAPVGTVVIIGRSGTLKAGLTRENALNLIAWLILSTDAKPVEIAAMLRDACTPTPPVVGKTQSLPPPAVEKQLSPPVQVPPAGTVVKEFIGDIDDEEAAALAQIKPVPSPKPEPARSDNTLEVWGAVK